ARGSAIRKGRGGRADSHPHCRGHRDVHGGDGAKAPDLPVGGHVDGAAQGLRCRPSTAGGRMSSLPGNVSLERSEGVSPYRRSSVVIDRATVGGNLADIYRIDEETQVLRRDAAVENLERAVSVGLTQRTGVVSVDVTSRYADLSLQICQRLLELLNSFNLETR